MKQPAVYIMASRRNGTIYTGVASNLIQRVYQHRGALVEGFTSRYDAELLVWFEQHQTMEATIRREKQLKGWRREWKVALIETVNSRWDDLAESLGFDPLPAA